MPDVPQGFPGGSVVKNLPVMQEMGIPSMSQEDPLEKEMRIHSSILAWQYQGQRSLVGYSPWGPKRVRHELATKQHALRLVNRGMRGF